jgi:hypothetical protein
MANPSSAATLIASEPTESAESELETISCQLLDQLGEYSGALVGLGLSEAAVVQVILEPMSVSDGVTT